MATGQVNPPAVVDFTRYLTPQQRGQAVREQLIGKVQDWYLPAGEYDFGTDPVPFPDGGIVAGAGRGKTILRSAAVFTKAAATAFGLGAGQTFVRNLTLVSNCEPNQQSAVVGFAADAAQPRSATLDNVEVIGHDWGVYQWAGPDLNSLEIINSAITAARVGVMLGRSSGKSAQTAKLRNVLIKLDPTLSNQGGAVTDPNYGGVFGVICRGGRCTLRDVAIFATGAPVGPRLVGVTDWFDGGQAGVIIDVGGLETSFKFGGAKEVFDVDVRMGRLLLGGSGGAADGGLSVRPRS